MPAKPLRAVPQKAALIDVPLVGWICGYDQEQGLVLVDFDCDGRLGKAESCPGI